MEDKEKQVEEMAQYLQGYVYPLDNNSIKNCRILASALISQGWVKPNEDTIVLSGEEYADLKQAKSLLEFREETIKYLEDANIRYYETLTDVFNRWVETDKETGGFNLNYIYDLAHFYEIEIKE